jgi:predicted dehydrogenase
MPARIRAHCGFGRYHKIEVEDDVTAWLEYPGGATGVFITSTGEAPGTNRLEAAGERGKLLYEGGKLTFQRNEVPMSEFSRTTKASFASPEVWNATIPIHGQEGGHMEIVRNFADAILDGQELIAPATEGVRSVELANAMLFSALREETIELPLNAAAYEKQLLKLAAKSPKKKTARKPAPADFANSFR